MSRKALVPIVLPADPANPLEAATKQYVDGLVGSGGGPVELGYVTTTSNVSVTATTSATSQLVVALGAITYTAVPHEFEWFSPFVFTAATAGAQTHLGLYDGSASTPLGRVTVRNPTASASNGWPAYGVLRMTPSAGSHTYQIRTYTTTTGGGVNAGAGGSDVTVPAYIKVTRL